MRRTIHVIDRFSYWFCHILCFIVLPLIAAMVFEIFMRYVYVRPTVWAYDLARMLYGAMFILGAGYALFKGVHIRADLYGQILPVDGGYTAK